MNPDTSPSSARWAGVATLASALICAVCLFIALLGIGHIGDGQREIQGMLVEQKSRAFVLHYEATVRPSMGEPVKVAIDGAPGEGGASLAIRFKDEIDRIKSGN